MNLNRSASLVIGQAVISGQVVDSVTELPITDYTVRLVDRGVNPAVLLAPTRFGLALRQTAGGHFCFFGDPEAIVLDKNKQYKWRVEIATAGYQQLNKPFQFGPLGTQPDWQEFIRDVPGDAIRVRLFSAGLPAQLGVLKLVALS